MESHSPINNSTLVVRTKDVCNGRPRLNNTRLEVYNIISDIKYSNNLLDYLNERELTVSVVKEVIDYCKNLKCQNINEDFEKYCSNCILSTLHEKYNYKSNFGKIDEGVYLNNDFGFLALGDIGDIQDEEFGKPGWVIAGSINMQE